MHPLFSDELRDRLAWSWGRPLEVVDPTTQKRYVILDAGVYENLRHVIDIGDFDVVEAYPIQSAVAASTGWADPEMDAYDRLPIEDRSHEGQS